jgi:type I restriction enzyme S subunit
MPTVEAFEVCIPDLKEQKRIVCSLDEQIEAVEVARVAAEAQLEAAKALPAAYLRTVFESSTAQAWPRRTLAEVSEIVGGVQKSPDRVPVRLHRPYLTVRNVQRGFLNLSEVERFEVTPEEIERLRLLSGDILVVEGNGSIDQIGRNAMFVADGQEWIHQNHVIRVRLDSAAGRPEFVSCFLNSDLGRAQMVKKAETTSGLYTLSAGKVASLEVPLPSLSAQERILLALGERMGEVERVMKTAEEQLAAIRSLQAALLRRAFSGEL